MRKILAGFFALCMFGVANAQVTYTFTAGSYTSVLDFTSCPVGETCANYTTAMNQSGSITVATALAPNLVDSDIAALVTAYSFSDGINTYSNTANDRVGSFFVDTDASGNIISADGIQVQKWLSGTNGSHAVGDRVSFMLLAGLSINNSSCGVVSRGDTCSVDSGGTGRSLAFGPAATFTRIATPSPASVPTLSEWAMIIMASLVAMFAMTRMRRSG